VNAACERYATSQHRTGEAKEIEESYRIAAEVLATNPQDIPFALLYLVDGSRKQPRSVAAAGLEKGVAASPAVVDLTAALQPGPTSTGSHSRVLANGAMRRSSCWSRVKADTVTQLSGLIAPFQGTTTINVQIKNRKEGHHAPIEVARS
jgi:hypothetical protein